MCDPSKIDADGKKIKLVNVIVAERRVFLTGFCPVFLNITEVTAHLSSSSRII